MTSTASQNARRIRVCVGLMAASDLENESDAAIRTTPPNEI